MELILQQNLPHQQKAIDAINEAFDGVQPIAPVQFYENPQIPLNDPKFGVNIRAIQKSIPAEYRSTSPVGNCLNLDIKMETGTGKTYVYTKTIYELHKRFGINKFIIAVPSLAIKAGTAQFLKDAYVKRHFSDGCGYGTEIDVGVLEAQKSKKKGRSYFPSVVADFVKGSCQSTKKIYVLLVNMQLLTNAKVLTKDDYDYGVEGFYRPLDAIRATKPFVLIDEPHRFSRDQKAFKVIQEEIQPQCIIRFGATFPETTTGKGKAKTTIKDYENLLYDLNACASFNQGLIKGVAKEHFEPASKKEEKVKITSIDSKEAVHFQYKKKDEAATCYILMQITVKIRAEVLKKETVCMRSSILSIPIHLQESLSMGWIDTRKKSPKCGILLATKLRLLSITWVTLIWKTQYDCCEGSRNTISLGWKIHCHVHLLKNTRSLHQ